MFCSVLLFLDSLGGGELLVILLFIVIFFGSKKVPDLAKGLGKGIREFKNAMNDVRSEIEEAGNEMINPPISQNQNEKKEPLPPEQHEQE
ncbi:MAG: twin-arginine translocase TatA/TatE family subunit [Bacteroidia bacterium]|nr:twin-arginine translocase TatA/TatE family subunit [Bacteroidia bacterium]MCZ2276924.1 twin-arginine translocase TatA/TatE family subunit [Bacteroidia bacterium]